MHILYFHQHFSTPNGTAGIRSYQLAQRAIQKGHRVTMVCGSYEGGDTGITSPFRKGQRRGTVNGIEIIEFDLAYSNSDPFWTRTKTFLRFAFRSVTIALRTRYDIIFATTTPLTAGIPGIVARWLIGTQFVFEVRDLWPELPKAMGVIQNPIALSGMSILEWLSYKSAHRLIGLSPGIVEGIARRGIPKSRIALVPNACNLGIFSSTVDAWQPAGVSDDDLLAVFTGTHGVANGVNAALDAARVLLERGRTDIKIVLIGHGKLKPQLRERAAVEKLTNVVFLDPVNKLKLAALLARADLGLQLLANIPAFYYGTSPNKFFDYIAAGKPVLNNYPGWLAQLILDNRCGYAIPPENPTAFADALEHAASIKHAELKRFGENSLALARTTFDQSVLSQTWVEWVIQHKEREAHEAAY